MNGTLVGVAFALTLCGTAQAFDAAAFREPPSEFSPGYFWIFNAPMEVPVLNAQLDEMASVGLRNICPHAFPKGFRPTQCQSTMTPEYLTDGYIDAYGQALAHANDLGFSVWLYDEAGWPSGNAGGLVAQSDKDGRFCARSLRIGADGKPELFVEPYGPNWKPRPSVIEPGTTERFLEITHDRLAAAYGKYFGKMIRFTFTDEPSRPNAGLGKIAWTSDFDAEFQRRKGYAIRPYAAFLIAGTNAVSAATAAETQARIDYEDVMSQLFCERYLEPIRRWCQAHGLRSGGHLNGEDEPENAVRYAHGSLLRGLRHLDVPGVDTIWRQIFPSYPGRPGRQAPFPRYASSVAHRSGARHVLSESFAIYGDSLTPDQMKWIVDYQLVRGITVFVFSYSAVSNDGQWMDLFEPHAGPVQPYRPFSKPFYTYVHRMSALLSQGEATTETAVVFDTRDFWSNGPDRAAAAKAHYDVSTALDRRNCEYDFIDDEEIAGAAVEGRGLRIGKMSYKTVVLPHSKWLLPAARAKLDAFKKVGGRVLGPKELAEVAPTVVVTGDGAADIRVMKRRDGDRTLWFFANESVEPRTVRLEVGCAGCAREVTSTTGASREVTSTTGALLRADAETGAFVPLAANADGSVDWAFPGCGSLAVVGGKGETLSWQARPLSRIRAGKTAFVREDLSTEPFRAVQLGDWRGWLGNDFSGVVRYRATYTAPAAGKIRIDLGKVSWTSRLFVNGREVATRFFGPHVYEAVVKAGENILEVDVANTLANAIQSDEVRDRIARDYPPRSRYDVHQRVFDREFNESGLLGPVRVTVPECGD